MATIEKEGLPGQIPGNFPDLTAPTTLDPEELPRDRESNEGSEDAEGYGLVHVVEIRARHRRHPRRRYLAG